MTNFIQSDEPTAPEAGAPNGDVAETAEGAEGAEGADGADGDVEDAGDGNYTYQCKMCVDRRVANLL